MDGFCDDYFHYNLKFPPTFFEPPKNQIEDCEHVMKSAVLNYLRSSCHDRIKHHNAILNSGLTAGEAAMLHLQAKDSSSRTSKGPMYNFLCDCIKTHFGVNPDDYPNINYHLAIENVPDQQLEAKIRHCIKIFLQEINLKSKGYTFILKTIVAQMREAKQKKLI